ncbi:MAG: enoyl-CoA hydratase-related protein [Gammaproteobacteria bacterium]|nr:enoyl-CoA hydratase-related protein [Gammaproteobacteria bacterium]
MQSPHPLLKITRIHSHILHISLNRPDAMNALSADLLKELHLAFTEAKSDTSVRALLLTGEGKVFCAGADIKQLAPLTQADGLAFAEEGQRVFNALEQLGKPSLAAIHGVALGGGCELAMAATLRIAADTASLGQPEIKLGVIPGFGGTQRLARLVGRGRALDLCLTGRMLKAPDALLYGLVTEVVPAADLENRAIQILESLSQLAPIALQSIMTVIYEGCDLPLHDALKLEAKYFAQCCGTQDKQEGVSAFLEKRTAKFGGE